MIVIPKKPPPANSATWRRKGFSRVAKSNAVSIDSSRNGTLKCAPKLMFVSAKTPTARSGIARSNPALIPSALTSRYGGSLNPSSGITSFSVLTNSSGPANTISPSCTSTSGFLPGCIENSSTWNGSSMKGVAPISRSVNGDSEHETRALGSLPGFVGAWTSTATDSLARSSTGLKIAVAASGHGPTSVDQSSRAVTTSGSFSPRANCTSASAAAVTAAAFSS